MNHLAFATNDIAGILDRNKNVWVQKMLEFTP